MAKFKFATELNDEEESKPITKAGNAPTFKFATDLNQGGTEPIKKSFTPTISMGDFRKLDSAISTPEKTTPISNYRMLDNKISANPIIGENAFLTNAFPIRQDDSIAKKGLKGAGNLLLSALSAPGEALRKASLQGGSLLSGNGIQELPKNTSFVNDILPQGASSAVNSFREKNPLLGGIANMALETAVDPTVYIGGGTIKRMVTPKSEQGIAALKPLPKVKSEITAEGKQAWDDIQSAYKSPTLRDVKAKQLGDTFADAPLGVKPVKLKPLQKAIDDTVGVRSPLDEGLLKQRQLDAQSAFGGPREAIRGRFTTGEQRAFQELQNGITEAQNFTRHTDVLAPYPPGTTVQAAYADIKANIGVDLPKLLSNYEKAQKVKGPLTQAERVMGRKAGVIPPLKQREGFPVSQEAPVQTRITPEQPAPLRWTNRDGIGSFDSPAPIRSINEQNVGMLPGRQVEELRGPEPITTQGGGPIRPMGEQVTPMAQQAPTELPTPQSSIIIGKQKDKIGIKDSFRNAYDRIVNNQQAIVDGAKITNSDMGRLASNTKNVSGIVDYNFLKGMVNKKGENVSGSLKSTIDKIPKGKEEDFWTYMSQRHNIDRAREGKNVQANYTPEMSAGAVRIAEEANPAYKAAGDNIVKWLDDFMTTWGVETGIVNKEVYANLRQTYKSYFPTQRDFSELEKAIPDNVSQKFADQRTPIRKATGSKRDIIDPVENIMKLVDRTIRTAKYNEVGQSLLDSVRTAPEKLKPLAEVIEVKDGMFANTDNIITVLEDGKPVYLKINDKRFLDAMNGLPKSIGQIPVLSTLTNGFKQLITQSNPIFAVRNIFRDIPTAYVYGSEANPIKFGAGLIGAAKDIAANSPRLQKYQAVGGGGANFFSAGDITKSAAELTGKSNIVKKVVSAPIKAIQKFNNMTETAPRLSEFNRVLAKTGDVDKALFAANDVTVNFSRGGNITKNVDKVVPYMNAGVQGLDKFFRGFKDPKIAIQTITKSGVAITTPTLALYLVNKDNPNYAALDNRTKDNYYLIPKEDGTFIKLPKSRELGVLFSSLLERGLRTNAGQENSFKGFGNTVATNFSPANPIDSNFFAPATWNIATNKDFANRAIVPQSMKMDKRSRYLQYDEKTTEIAKAIGEMSKDVIPGGISPKQLDYLVKSYSGVLGQFGMPLATPGGKEPGKILSQQFTADSTFSNQTTTDFYDKLDKLSAKAIDKNIVEKIPSKKLTPEEDMRNSMNGISSALSKGTKQINTLLASDDPQKDAKIKAIKVRMLELSRKSVLADTPRLMQRVEDEAKKIFK